MKQKFYVLLNKKKIGIEAERCSLFGKFRGLMFRKKENAPALLFEFKKATKIKLHSIFVFFDFYTLTLDEKNNVLEIKKVSPFKISISPGKKKTKILEIPLNKRYAGLISRLTKRNFIT